MQVSELILERNSEWGSYKGSTVYLPDDRCFAVWRNTVHGEFLFAYCWEPWVENRELYAEYWHSIDELTAQCLISAALKGELDTMVKSNARD